MNAHQKNCLAYRDLLVGRAVRQRKITADRAPDYKRLWNADPHGMTQLLTAQASPMPAAAAPAAAPMPVADDDYPREWIGASRPTGAVAFEDAAATAASEGAALQNAEPELKPPPKPSGRVIMEEI